MPLDTATPRAYFDVTLEVGTFTNVGLFERGLYSLHSRLQFNGGKGIDIRSTSTGGAAVKNLKVSSDDVTFESAASVIQYRMEKIRLNQQMKFHGEVCLDMKSYVSQLAKISATLTVELWFHSDKEASMKKVSLRKFQIRGILVPGVAGNVFVLFDYFHTASVDVHIRSALTGFSTRSPVSSQPSSPTKTAPDTQISCIPVFSSTRPLMYNFVSHLPACNAEFEQSNTEQSRDGRYTVNPWQEELRSLWISLSLLVILPLRRRCELVDLPSTETLEGIISNAAAKGVSLMKVSSFHRGVEALEEYLQEFSDLGEQLWKEADETLSFNQAMWEKLLEFRTQEEVTRYSLGYFIRSVTPEKDSASEELWGASPHHISHRLRNSTLYQIHPKMQIERIDEKETLKHYATMFEERLMQLHDISCNPLEPASGDVFREDVVSISSAEDIAAVARAAANGAEVLPDEICSRPHVHSPLVASGQRSPASRRARSPKTTNAQEFLTINGHVDQTSDTPSHTDLYLEAALELHQCISDAQNLAEPTQIAAMEEELTETLKLRNSFFSEVEPRSTEYIRPSNLGQGHLVVCVHGLAGNQYDLREFQIHLSLAMPDANFLMAASNQSNTHSSFDEMADNLATELSEALVQHRPQRVSFVGHSLGAVIIRCLLSRPDVAGMFCKHTDINQEADSRPRLHTFLSLSGPHLGSLYVNGLINTGLWIFSKWNRSKSLSQLHLTDHRDPESTFMYKLSQKHGLDYFRNVILISSPQDKYVPSPSALLQHCQQADHDSKYGPIFKEMRQNILTHMRKSGTHVSRIHAVMPHTSRGLNSFIGRAAHISMLDDELFTRKYVACLLHYFV